MLYKYEKSTPRWINFENPKGEKGKGATENFGAKGHAWEHFLENEEKILCDFCGAGVVRRIWITLNDRSPEVLQNVILKMYWDNAENPQVSAPIGDFFCMGLGQMARFENALFSTAEGRSFCSFIPMPFKKHCKITLTNNSGKFINNLFYDINITLQELTDDDMYFFASFQDIPENKLEKDIEILPKTIGTGRFLGTNIAVIPNEALYGDIWWGEGEVKIYIDGDTDFPTLAGTGAEDYIGSAWELGEFQNRTQGCVTRDKNAVSMYRFHIDDPICFENDIKVTLQAMGGGMADKVIPILQNGVPVTYDDGDIHHVYKKEINEELKGYVNFFRRDHYRVVAYYYKKDLF